MTPRERTLVIITLAFTLVGALVWGATRLIDARDAAAEAAVSLADCRKLAADIASRRGAPADPGVGVPQGAEVTRRVESAAKTAGFAPGSIERIEPAPVRPPVDAAAGKGQLGERPTVVQLRNVTLRQMFTFFRAVGGGGGGGRRSSLQLRQVRLSAPSSEDTGGRWAVESTLTYPVFAAGGVDGSREVK
jgi:hypothetical protein